MWSATRLASSFCRKLPTVPRFYGFYRESKGAQLVLEYIAGQEEHHRRMTFQDELRALLRKHEIQFDERYVWD